MTRLCGLQDDVYNLLCSHVGAWVHRDAIVEGLGKPTRRAHLSQVLRGLRVRRLIEYRPVSNEYRVAAWIVRTAILLEPHMPASPPAARADDATT